MSENSKIEWTDATWNPILGCSKISPGCKYCYAIRTAWRLQHNPNPKVHEAFKGLTVIQGGSPNWTGRVNFVPERLAEPLRWKKPLQIFVNSQSDLFHEEVADQTIAAIFGVMAAAKQHIFQVLTKRPERALQWFHWIATGDVEHAAIRGCTLAAAKALGESFASFAGPGVRGEIAWPLPNVWLGVSAENQEYADDRIPTLLQIPAAMRWVSAEPLLGPIDLEHLVFGRKSIPGGRTVPLRKLNALKPMQHLFDECDVYTEALNWLVAGGESGPEARPMHPDWARSLRNQCQTAGVPFFFKQWGAFKPVGPLYSKEDTPEHLAALDIAGHQDGVLLSPNGSHWEDEPAQPPPGTWALECVGKKAAGCLLDGKEHKEYPEAAR